MQKRILLAAGLYSPDMGGPATFAKLLHDKLPEKEVFVTVIPFNSVRAYSKLFRHFIYFYKLYKAAKGVDVIVALDPVSVGLPTLLVSWVRRKPFILRLGGDYAWEQGRQRFGLTKNLDDYTKERIKASIWVRLLHRIQETVARRAISIVVPSAYLASIVGTWNLDKKKIKVIHSALTPLVPTRARAEARAHYQAHGFTIVTSPRLTPWKGVGALIDAFVSLRLQGITATLLIAGDGPLRSDLEQQAKASDYHDSIHFLGVLNQTDHANLIIAGDVYVLNTAYEGLSHQLLEVMQLGVPIITTPVGGNTELVEQEKNGILVSFNDVKALTDAMSKLFHEPALGAQLVNDAKEVSKRFKQTDSVQAWADLIKTYG